MSDKLVDGVLVPLTAEEEAAMVARAAVVLVPKEVTMRQARLALRAAGKLAAVAAAIEAMPSPTKEDAKIEWEYSKQDRKAGTAKGKTAGSWDLSKNAAS